MDVRLRGDCLQPAAVATRTRDGDRELGVASLHLRRRSDEHVEPLAGHEPADPRDDRSVEGKVEPLPSLFALDVAERAEALDVDTGRDVDGREGAAGGALGFG